jgi:hypothetical protein
MRMHRSTPGAAHIGSDGRRREVGSQPDSDVHGRVGSLVYPGAPRADGAAAAPHRRPYEAEEAVAAAPTPPRMCRIFTATISASPNRV